MTTKFGNAVRALVVIWMALSSCKQESKPGGQRLAVAPPSRPSASIAKTTAKEPVAPSQPLPAPPPEREEPAEQLASSSQARPGATSIGSSLLVIDDLVDVAPAGPSAATPTGVLLVLRDLRFAFAPLIRGPQTLSKRPVKTPLLPIDLPKELLVALEHGPAVAEGYAYFIHEGHLARRQLPNGPIEDLASDARSHTRVTVPDVRLPKQPMVVGYIARHPTDKDTLLAKLWVEGQPSLVLTPDGSTGHSVALSRAKNGYVAISLESRTGMSPLHARRITFENGKARVGQDVVPWVAGTAQPLTELRTVSNSDNVWAMLPIERDALRFGLARIEIGPFPRMSSQVHWREYPNGLEPATVATGTLCGKPAVIYARPSSTALHAPQELHLSTVESFGLGPSTVIATSRAFADASFAGLDDGALVVYVADRRTWARRLRCVPR